MTPQQRAWAEKREEILEKRRQHPNYSSPLRVERIRQAAIARAADDAWLSKPNRSCVAVTVNGVTYRSINAAKRATGLSRVQILKVRE